jgi:hypothetical protein
MSGAAKREKVSIGSVSIEWAVVALAADHGGML